MVELEVVSCLRVICISLIFDHEPIILCVCVCVCVCAQSCPILCNPMDCSLPGSSVHGISQARILEWVAISYCRGSSWPRVWTQVSTLLVHWQADSLPLHHLGSPNLMTALQWDTKVSELFRTPPPSKMTPIAFKPLICKPCLQIQVRSLSHTHWIWVFHLLLYIYFFNLFDCAGF